VIFVDSSALYAVLAHGDSRHEAAAALWRKVVENHSLLITTNYILLETAALLQNRLGVEAVRALQKMALLLRVHWVTEGEHRAAVQALLLANRRKLSLVDCVSFEVMRARSARVAFAFDDHFAEQGFEILGLRGSA
jgi:predicted nucleic acid-binding protein